MNVGESVRIVLETDGTQVEDGEYFQTLPENTIFIVLRSGEAWAPPGETDIVSQGGIQFTGSIIKVYMYSIAVVSTIPLCNASAMPKRSGSCCHDMSGS